jgi:hypothetical protein
MLPTPPSQLHRIDLPAIFVVAGLDESRDRAASAAFPNANMRVEYSVEQDCAE